MAAIDELLAKKPRQRDVTIVTDPDSSPPTTVTLSFRALPRDQWRKLIERHPATDEQQNEFVQAQQRQGINPTRFQRLRWNADTFPPAAIAACCDQLDVDDAELLWASEVYTTDELERLMAAVLAANESAEGTVVWGKGSAPTLGSATS